MFLMEYWHFIYKSDMEGEEDRINPD